MTTNNKDLVTTNNGKIFTTSLIVADGVGNEHKTVIRLVRKYQEDFEEFGPLNFQSSVGAKLPQGGYAKDTEYALLTEDQATYLMTLFRNTPIVRRFKVDLVKAFRRAIDTLNDLRSNANKANKTKPKQLQNLEDHLAAIKAKFDIPETLGDALVLAGNFSKKVDRLEAKIKRDKPKVVYATLVQGSSTLTGLRCWIKEMRSEHGLTATQREVFAYLKGKYLYKSGGIYYPYDKYEPHKRNYFEVVEVEARNNEFVDQTKITGKGKVYLTHKVLEHFNPQGDDL